jgi:hypothetical protein
MFFLSFHKIKLRQPIGRQEGRYFFNARCFSKIAISDFCSKRLVWHIELQLKVKEKTKNNILI